MTASDFTYTPEAFDAIARAACESLVFHPGRVAPYDVEAYRRIDHAPVETGGYPCFNQGGTSETGGDAVPDDCLAPHGYLVRMGGFRRADIFGPCEAADRIARAGIHYADGLGDGMFEHLLLCRRTGVMPIFEAPTMGIPLPFLASELSAFESVYRRHALEYRDWITRIEAVYGHGLLDREGHPWILYLRTAPLMLFQLSVQRQPAATAAELKTHAGVTRLTADPRTPVERAGQARAWSFVRRRHMEVLALMGRVFREVVAPRGVLIGNMHTLPIVDYHLMGEVFEHPGVAARSGYIDTPALRDPYMGYSVRLFSDLSGRLPVMSVRINTLVSGTRFIPGPDTIRAWCDTVIRHGVRGFYFWTTDYPSQKGQYFGSLPGNPDPSTRGPQRWDAMLDCMRDIAPARALLPPDADVGILAPAEVLDVTGWRRVLGCFTELESARIWSRLVGGRAAEDDPTTLERYRALVVPSLPFTTDGLADALEAYVRKGGTILLGDRTFGRFNLEGAPRRAVGGLTDAQLDRPGALDVNVGRGRILADAAPGLGTAIDAIDVEAALSEAIGQWHRYAEDLGVPRDHWVYRVTVANLHGLAGDAPPSARPAPEPDLEPRAYLYEHSSPLIIPYIENPADFPGGGV